MAEIVTALIAHLNSRADVFAVFSNRITENLIPDNQPRPCARITTVSNPQQYHMRGASVRRVTLQIDVYADTQTVRDISAAVITSALSGYAGAVGNINVGYIFIRNDLATYNEEARAFQRIIDLELATND